LARNYPSAPKRFNRVLERRIEGKVLGLRRIKKLKQVKIQSADAESVRRTFSLEWSPEANLEGYYESAWRDRNIITAIDSLQVLS